MDTANLTLEQLKTRIRVTKEQIEAFSAAFMARTAEKRPENVPEWAWKAEIDGISSILVDLTNELAVLEQEEKQCSGSTEQ